MRNVSRITRVTALAFSVGMVLSAGSAMAQEALYSGGSTFAAPVYVGNDYLLTTPNESRLSTNAGNTAGAGFETADITAGSLFDAYHTAYGNTTSFCQTGSGFGKNSLNGVSTALASSQCNDYSTSPNGLSAPTNSPDFIGTDAPYSTTDYNAFLSGPQASGHTGVTQIPVFAGAIALPHNTSVSNVAMTTAAVCKVFSGVTKNWSGIKGVTGAKSKPIFIVYRSDSSGTSFAFTRFLAASCNGTANVPSGFVFTPNSTFASSMVGGPTGVYGTNTIGESGNPGVVGEVVATPSALGYADVGEVINEGAAYATVNGFDPTQFGQVGGVATPITITSANLEKDKVLDGATLDPMPAGVSTTVGNCMRVVNPAIKLGSSTYPIAAVTYLAGYYSGNGTASHITAIQNMYNFFYNHALRPALPTGYAYLDGNATFASSVKSTVTACVKP